MGFTLDPVSGKPIYDGDISDPVGQFQASVDYAERLGARRVATVADLSSIPYPVAGQLAVVASPRSLYVREGSDWAPLIVGRTAFTPEWTGLAVGNGSQAWTYSVAGGICHVDGRVTLGSSSGFSGPIMTLPVPMVTEGFSSTVYYIDVSAGPSGRYLGHLRKATSATAVFEVIGSETDYARARGMSSIVPFAWSGADGDSIVASFSYRI